MDEKLREKVLKWFPYGLYAIGVRRGDERNAFTANWVMQCSFEPPMVAVAVENDGRSIDMIRESGVFSVNVFESGQRREAGRLARPAARAPDKLQEFEYRDGVTGAPLITACLGYVECRVEAEVPTGDHTLFIGVVVDAGVFRDGRPITIQEAGFTYAG
ncbi:MAG TPA: flavin reductase family protein [Longimicrobiales bacterium]|nr:flavin reductase family protein [Longimicrobiales bacterium]